MFERREFSLAKFSDWMDAVGAGPQTWAGNHVSEQSALRTTAVWACVNLISGAFSILPGKVYRSVERGSEEDRGHYLYPVVHDMANPEMPACEYRRISLAHLLTWGNHYSFIERDKGMRVRALWPLCPDRVEARRKDSKSPISYKLRMDDGTDHEFDPDDILHIRGLGFDGVTGYSPIGMARQTVGLAQASEESASRLFRNGMTSRLVLQHPGTITDDQTTKLRESFGKAYESLQNMHRAIVLQGGMTAQAITINPRDSQFIEQRQFQDSKIYQMFLVPPHMVGDTEKATSWGTGIEQQVIGFVTFCLLPWIKIWEQWMSWKLLGIRATSHYVEFNVDGLLRGDSQARAAFYKVLWDIGAISHNEIRRRENLNGIPAGDVYARPMNIRFVDADGNVKYETAPEEQKPQEIELDKRAIALLASMYSAGKPNGSLHHQEAQR